MNSRAPSTLAFLALIICAATALAQNRFDVSIEGPWILYEFKNFDGAHSMLVAIAPEVPGHYPPVFTTGSGTAVGEGIYCVAFVGNAFDGKCTPNGNTWPSSGTGTYDPTHFVPVGIRGSIPWAALISEHVRAFILPVPDSVSNDGIDNELTFRNDFHGAAGGPQPSTIGVQLHYGKGPLNFHLLRCTSDPPSVAGCSTDNGASQPNSGTLRITMKAEEHTEADDPCDYHVRMAHHKMLAFLDPSVLSLGHNQNQKIAYVEHAQDTASCRACDPQQESITPDCAYAPGFHMTDLGSVPDIGASLNDFNGLFIGLDRDPGSCQLAGLADKLKGKIPTLEQLSALEHALDCSAQKLNKDLDAESRIPKQGSAKSTVLVERKLAIEAALAQNRELQHQVEYARRAATSGKDCRVAIMLVQ